MKKAFFMILVLAVLLAIGLNNYQLLTGEVSDLGRRPGNARLVGYSLVKKDDAQALIIQDLKVLPNVDRLDINFDLVSQYGLNEFPGFKVTITTNSGGIRVIDVPAQKYVHPDGPVTIAPISFSIPRTGSEVGVTLKAVYP